MGLMHPARAAIRVLATAIATLAVLDGVVYGSGLHDRLLHRYFPWVDRQPAKVLALTSRLRPRLVALGDSKVRRGFRPTVFEDAAGLAGHGVTAGQLGVITQPLGFMYPMLRQYLEMAPAPAVALLMLAPSDFYWWPPEKVPAQMYDLYRSADDWPETFTPRARAEMWLSRLWPLWRYRSETSQVIAVALTQSSGETAESLAPPPQADPWWVADTQRGWWPTERSYTVRVVDSQYANCRRYPFSAQSKLFGRLLDLCRAHRIRPIIVWMPQFGHTSADADGADAMAFLRRLGADDVVDMSHACQARRFWQDGTHLNTAGALRFSRDLGRYLGPRVRDDLRRHAAATGS